MFLVTKSLNSSYLLKRLVKDEILALKFKQLMLSVSLYFTNAS